MFGNKMSKVTHAVEKGKASALVELTKDRDDAVRLAAIDGLGKIKSTDGVNILVSLLHDPSAEVRGHAALALGEIGDSHSKAHIAFAAEKESDAKAKDSMVKALGKLKDY